MGPKAWAGHHLHFHSERTLSLQTEPGLQAVACLGPALHWAFPQSGKEATLSPANPGPWLPNPFLYKREIEIFPLSVVPFDWKVHSQPLHSMLG